MYITVWNFVYIHSHTNSLYHAMIFVMFLKGMLSLCKQAKINYCFIFSHLVYVPKSVDIA